MATNYGDTISSSFSKYTGSGYTPQQVYNAFKTKFAGLNPTEQTAASKALEDYYKTTYTNPPAVSNVVATPAAMPKPAAVAEPTVAKSAIPDLPYSTPALNAKRAAGTLNENEKMTLIAQLRDQGGMNDVQKSAAESKLNAYKQKLWQQAGGIGKFDPEAFSKDYTNGIILDKMKVKTESAPGESASASVKDIGGTETFNKALEAEKANLQSKTANAVLLQQESNRATQDIWDKYKSELETKYGAQQKAIDAMSVQIDTQDKDIRALAGEILDQSTKAATEANARSQAKTGAMLTGKGLSAGSVASAMAEIASSPDFLKRISDVKQNYYNALVNQNDKLNTAKQSILNQQASLTDSEKALLESYNKQLIDNQNAISTLKQDGNKAIYDMITAINTESLKTLSANEAKQKDIEDTIKQYASASNEEKSRYLMDGLYNYDQNLQRSKLSTEDIDKAISTYGNDFVKARQYLANVISQRSGGTTSGGTSYSSPSYSGSAGGTGGTGAPSSPRTTPTGGTAGKTTSAGTTSAQSSDQVAAEMDKINSRMQAALNEGMSLDQYYKKYPNDMSYLQNVGAFQQVSDIYKQNASVKKTSGASGSGVIQNLKTGKSLLDTALSGKERMEATAGQKSASTVTQIFNNSLNARLSGTEFARALLNSEQGASLKNNPTRLKSFVDAYNKKRAQLGK